MISVSQECIEIVKDVEDGSLILGFAIGGGIDQDASKNPFVPNDPVCSLMLLLIAQQKTYTSPYRTSLASYGVEPRLGLGTMI